MVNLSFDQLEREELLLASRWCSQPPEPSQRLQLPLVWLAMEQRQGLLCPNDASPKLPSVLLVWLGLE